MANFPGPYELRIGYTTNGNTSLNIDHEHRVSLALSGVPDPGDDFSLIQVQTHSNASTPALDDMVDEYVALLRPLLATTSSINGAELWKYVEGTYNADFISAYPIALAGLGTGSSQSARQDTLTFRSSMGGTARFTILESRETAGSGKYTPLGGSADMDAIVAYYTNVNKWILARDNGRPFYALNYFVGQNEALFKRRFR